MTLEEAKKKIKAQAEAEWEEYKKSGSMLCQGFALGADYALETLDKVEPVGNPDKLTLTELARELRKKCNFKYMTAESGLGDLSTAHLWSDKPYFDVAKTWICTKGRMYGWLASDVFPFTLDLSEYRDADGNIDYSRCIVEVADDIN